MKEYIELGRKREFGEVMSDTFTFITQNFKQLLISCLVIWGLFLIANILLSTYINTNINVLSDNDFDDPAARLFWKFTEIGFTLISHIILTLTIISYVAVYKDKGNQPAEVVEVWGYFRYYFFRGFFTYIILVIAEIIGFFFCFLPGIYLAVVFALVMPIMIIENGGIEYSIRKAFQIIKENWWFTFGILILLSIITIVATFLLQLPGMIIYGIGQWLTGKSLSQSGGILEAVIRNICQILWLVPYIATVMIYFSFTEQKEGNTLLDRIKKFGKNTPNSDQVSPEEF